MVSRSMAFSFSTRMSFPLYWSEIGSSFASGFGVFACTPNSRIQSFLVSVLWKNYLCEPWTGSEQESNQNSATISRACRTIFNLVYRVQPDQTSGRASLQLQRAILLFWIAQWTFRKCGSFVHLSYSADWESGNKKQESWFTIIHHCI